MATISRIAGLPSCASALLAGASLCTAAAMAQSYPTKPIRLIVPLAPGGPSDILARTVAQKLTESLGQPVVVDNRSGAGGSLGTEIAVKSPPDGYTIILVSNSLSINPSLYPKLPYDPVRDLQPIALLAEAPYMLVTHPLLPVKSVKGLIALAKARRGQLNYASGGSGTGPHLAMEVFKLMAGIDMTHIPYKGAGPAMIDLIAGQAQVMFANIIASLPFIRSGRMKALAVSSAKRSPAAPEIPAVAESGLAGFNESGQHGILAPAGTPREVVQRLNAEIVKALNLPEIKERLASEGAAIVGSTPEHYAAVIRSDVAKWAKVIKSSGIRAD